MNYRCECVATLALGLRLRQRGYKVAGQEEARESRQRRNPKIKAKRPQGCEPRRTPRQEKALESHHILPRVLESVKEYEGVNLHTPKITPTLGDGVPDALPSHGVKPT
jgi:hypothetical protein